MKLASILALVAFALTAAAVAQEKIISTSQKPCPDDSVPGDIAECSGPVDVHIFRMVLTPESSTIACKIMQPIPKASKNLFGAKLQQAIDSANLMPAGSVARDGRFIGIGTKN